MCSFFSMADTYESRKVARDEFSIDGVKVVVSTAKVTDSRDPYETCILFETSNKVVEMYDKHESAEAGHDRWVSFIKKNKITSLDNFKDQGTNIFSILIRRMLEDK